MAKITIVSNRIINRRTLTGRRGVRKDVKYIEFRAADGQLHGADKSCMLADREVGAISGVRHLLNVLDAEGSWSVLPNGGTLGYYEGGLNSETSLPAGTLFKTAQEGNAAASSTYYVRRPGVDYSLGL
ncbi:MAG: hypothetical protein PHQ58_05005 [Rhodoferax sp.]|uniref:hypothetical protein n=1 Tax=Rhodoferax sp. TaxID=50421 RepID=UPI00263724E7|nr:hypothetical protein [Rhodoferax sp.]MDD2879773.1 hypothetical protein [Rhodoferax sp.]